MSKIVGVAGTFASGKDTASEQIAGQLDYLSVSTGDLVREETAKRGLSVHRDNLVGVANDLRATKGEGVLVEMALERQKKTSKNGVIITGIRHPGEVRAIHKANGIVLFIDAPIEKRYEWAKQRGRLEDKTTLEGFKNQEQRELANPDPGGQNIQAVRQLSDKAIENSGTIDDLVRKVKAAIST